MISDHFVVGVGPGNWKLQLPYYGLEELHPFYSEGIRMFRRANNDFLQVLSEAGIIWFTLFTSIYALVIIYLMKIKNRVTEPRDYIILVCLLFGFIGFFVIFFFSFPHERIEHSVLISLLIASVIVQHRKIFPRIRIPKLNHFDKVWKLGSHLILICCIGLGSSLYRSGVHARRALTAQAQQDWNMVIEDVKESSTPFYRLELSATPMSWYSGVAYYALSDYSNALLEFMDAYRHHPNHIHVLNNLASCYAKLDSIEKAKEYYNKALYISPNFRESLVNLGVIYFNSKSYSEAYKLFDKAYVLGGYDHLGTYLQKTREKLKQVGIKPSDIFSE